MSPEKMTTQIRAYLVCDALRHLAFGVALLLAPHVFNPSFKLLFEAAPHWVWVASLIVGAAHLGYAAASGNETHARLALVMSATVSVLWAVNFALIVVTGAPASGVSILFVALAAKDLIICSGPLHTPRSATPHVQRRT